MPPRIFHPIARFYSQQATAAALSRSATKVPHAQQKCIREQLRELLRETAQPVAVVTAFMPKTKTGQPGKSAQALYHGATLSSFTSIAMDPYPLITFALRIPSRMATTLNLAATLSSPAPAQMVINILSSTQAKHALVFSRPDLYPTPFTDPDIIFKPSDEGLPVLEGSLGAISCRLVGRGIPLHDMESLACMSNYSGASTYWDEEGSRTAARRTAGRDPAALKKGSVSSELFIAQVTRIEALASTPMMPLLYHRRKFTSCIPSPPNSLP